jgi:hypothetical protein
MGWEHVDTEHPCFCGRGKRIQRHSSDDFLHSKGTEWLTCETCKAEYVYVHADVSLASDIDGYWTKRSNVKRE